MNISQPYQDPLVAREIYAFNSCHALPLSLLVARVLANHVDLAAPADNLALGTALSNRSRNFHDLTFSLAGRLTK